MLRFVAHKRILIFGAFGCAFLIALTSCRTAPVPQRPGRVEALVEELQSAQIDRLVELTARPFLFDGEIIVLEQDIERMWRNLREEGFAFDDAVVTAVGAIDEDSRRSFGVGADVDAWFERYAAEGAGAATVETSFGTFLIVTGERAGRVPTIAGFTAATGGGS